MEKKIDLSKKNDNANFRPTRNPRPLPRQEIPQNQSEIDEENFEQNAASIDTFSQMTNNKTNFGLSNLFQSKTTTETTTESKVKVLMKNPIVKKVVYYGIPIVAISILAVLVLASIVMIILGYESNGTSISFGGYYGYRCNEVTVIDNPDAGTYNMTDYVAGVVAAEVGGFANKEVYKAFALAARTFVERNADDDCVIVGNATRQAFKDIRGSDISNYQLIYEAVEETEGKVIMSDGNLFSLQYDAFCFVSKDSQYYTLSQKSQKIPVNWAENNISSYNYKNCPCNANDTTKTECWDEEGRWEDGGHGNGMSQYGALYLSTEKGYTYDEILEYYYGDSEITISSNSFMSSIAGLEIKDTTGATPLNSPITDFLSSKGSSLEDLNTFIHDSVAEQGAGTREGVVTAAVSVINYLYDNFNTKLPYYWGGKVRSGAIPSSFGTYSPSSVSRGGNISYYKSFDCSGFVSWAIRNGGYNFTEQSTLGFDSNYSQNSCNITETTCIGQPGDLINSREGHVELIIAVDEASGKYFVAHSGNPGVVMQERSMHKGNSSTNTTKIIFMEEFYSNPLNVNPNY